MNKRNGDKAFLNRDGNTFECNMASQASGLFSIRKTESDPSPGNTNNSGTSNIGIPLYW